ncbi:hypothetical protein OsI_11499 [Oryza sativa Indica Group]|uniref:Uncharacterized protein n=1 Tax=Oryza sativa subsp. indica TaxID=39946 RepID=A2XGI7_ORYSI|nr:hypothetical protein OsI_11499 [Oryza sativa Indica Group]
MNSYSGDRSSSSSSSRPTTTSFDSYQFDFGVNSSRSSASRPLRPGPGATSGGAAAGGVGVGGSAWTHQPAKTTSWTHQPSPASAAAGAGSGPTSMVGDIFGRSWSSAAPSSGLGIPQANNPGLFSDLLGSALGSSSRGQPNAPLRSSAPQTYKPANANPNPSGSPFSMGGMASTLPKTATGSPMSSGGGGYGVGGRPMKPAGMASAAAAQPMMGQKKDPFGSIDPFAAKPGSMNAAKKANPVKPDQGFGAFQGVNSGGIAGLSGFQTADSGFGSFQSSGAVKPSSFTPLAPAPAPAPAAAAANSGVDHLDSLFASTTAAPTAVSNGGGGGDMFGEMDGWVDVEADFGSGDSGGATTELEGLPPPPSGLTASAAKSKGMDNYKGGQYADAIKWLSWAVVLIEKSGKDADIVEVLSSRASSYKEVGEYKKAIADCSKVLEKDKDNVSVLVQRALLYESSEKYRLGAEDLRLVLKIDPGNRLARSMIHRLNKMAD